MKWRFTIGVVLLALTVRAGAVELNPVCHTLYQQFNLPNLTYENVGKIADMMHDNECWPVLQGVPIQAASAEPELPAITDCASLAPHIVQMTRDQATETKPSIVKLYGIRGLDLEFCKKTGLLFEMPSADGKTVLTLDARVHNMMSDEFIGACGIAAGAAESHEGPKKVLNCVGTAKYTFGYSGDQERYFYLERFADGDEFLGISALRR